MLWAQPIQVNECRQMVVVQFDAYTTVVILSVAVFQA